MTNGQPAPEPDVEPARSERDVGQPAPEPDVDQPAPEPDVASPPEALSRVEAAVTTLADLDRRPLAEHPDAYDEFHRVLSDALSDIPS